MMKYSILPILLVITIANTYAQTITKQERGYFNLTEVTMFTGNNALDYQISQNQFATQTNSAGAFSLRNINGWFVTNKISLGVGVGMENYTLSDYRFDYDNLFLLFADVRYYFKHSKNTFFAYGDVGGGIKWDHDFNKGTMYNLGIGYKFMVGPKTALTAGLGYVDQAIKHEEPNTKERYYGFGFKAGLLF